MSKQTLHTLIAILFIISGATGLIYQILWFKYLSLFLGNTTYAQTVVLAAFMGGLAIGSAMWGRRADKLSRPLVLYGMLELGIGIYCLLYPWIISFVKVAFFQTVTSLALPSDSAVVLLLKLFASMITLLPPTILMGGTLPILVKTVSASVEESGRSVAVLYFLNSFGAVIGSILCGFFFIRLLGLSTTMVASAVANLIIGFAAIVLSRKITKPGNTLDGEATTIMRIFTKREIAIAIGVAGISGMAAMIYEVSWVRLLIPVFGSSTSSFSLMLIAFISGITIGSWIVSKELHRIRNLFSFLMLCQFGVAFGLFASLPLYGRIPYVFWHVSTLLTKSQATYPIFLSIEFTLCFLIMIIPTIFMGMTLPIASRIATQSIDKLGASVGNVFSINTFGTVVGSLIAGLILIPSIGIRHAFEAGIVLNLLAGMAILFADTRLKSLARVVTVGVTAGIVLLYFSVASDWNQLVMLSGVFRHVSEKQPPPRSFKQFVSDAGDKKDLYYKEGATATVGVVEAVVSGVRQKILLINGKGDASSIGDLSTQILLGQLPAMFHPNADTVLVIGLGSAVTVGSILTHPVHSVECVEISPEVVEAAHQFSDVNYNALADKRLAVRTEDALAYLHLTQKKYDVIVSEPSNPWIAGIGNLYTSEFFRACKSKLKKGGIMTQWFHIYEIDDDILKLVTRTFCGAFSNVTLWQTAASDIVFMGSDEPLALDLPMLKRKFQEERIKKDLARVHIIDVPTLLSIQNLSDEQCREYADYGSLNTEDLPSLEYASPRAFFINKGVPEFVTYDERPKYSAGRLLLQTYALEHGLTDGEKLGIGMLQASPWWGNASYAYSLLSEYNKKHSGDPTVLLTLAELTEQLGRFEESLAHWKTLVALQPKNPPLLAKYAWLKFSYDRPAASMLTRDNSQESENLLLRCIALTADTVDRYHIILGDIYFENQKYEDAAREYLRSAELRKTHASDPHFSLELLFAKIAKALYYSGRNDQALGYAAESSLLDPENNEVAQLIYRIAMRQSALHKSKTPNH